MRKGIIITIIIMILFTASVFFGVYTYEKIKTKDSNFINSKQLANLGESKQTSNENSESIETSVTEEKISPNCTIVEKQYFKGCDHLIKNIKEVPEEWVNLQNEDVKEKIKTYYLDWNLESFSNNQIIVSQEQDGYCTQHYVIREHNGVLGIYTLNENGEENFKEDTEISTRYLPDEDIQVLKEGIKAIGDDRLHTVLSDFE